MDAQTSAVQHDLKTWPPYFGAVFDGSKTFEVRRDDRGYRVGDVLRLREWDPARGDYTGRECRRTVAYICRDAEGLAAGFAVLGLDNRWSLACGLKDGHVKLAGPWRRWQDSGPSGWYRQTWDGGVAVRTDYDNTSPYRWAIGSAGEWQPESSLSAYYARLAADEWLRSNGWILSDGPL